MYVKLPLVMTVLQNMSESNKEEKGEEEKVYGGCEGPDAMYVKLISSDGHEFIVKRDHALTSGTIKAMLSGPGMYILKLIILLTAFDALVSRRRHEPHEQMTVV